jgi:hypothetical protein
MCRKITAFLAYKQVHDALSSAKIFKEVVNIIQLNLAILRHLEFLQGLGQGGFDIFLSLFRIKSTHAVRALLAAPKI